MGGGGGKRGMGRWVGCKEGRRETSEGRWEGRGGWRGGNGGTLGWSEAVVTGHGRGEGGRDLGLQAGKGQEGGEGRLLEVTRLRGGREGGRESKGEREKRERKTRERERPL